MPSQMQALAAWLMTYALHSTLLLGAAWLIVRHRRVSPAAADITWKVALVGGLITASAQGILAVRPTGSFAFAPTAASTESSLRAVADPDLIRIEADVVSGAPTSSPHENAADAMPAVQDAATGATLRIPSLPVLLSTAWLVVAVLLVGGYAARRLVLVGRLGDRRLVGDERVTDLLDTLRLETGVTSPIRLTTSRSISSPVALDGEICLPTAVVEELEPEQQRAMLAHELAHIVRRDPLWLAAACVVERAFFFQPLNRLARRGVQVSAEYLADEWAARRTGGVPLARALVKVAEWIQASPLGVPVAGFAEERSQLTVRVARLLDRTAWATSHSRWAAGALAAAMLVLTTAFAPGVSRLAAAGPLGTLGGSLAADGDAVQDETAQQRADTSVVAAVIERLRDEDEEVRQAAAHALGRIKHQSAIQPLVRALDDESDDVRRAALEALSQFDRGVPAAPIRRLLSHTDAEFRGEAAHMLGHMKDRASIPAITALLADVSDDVRYKALEALDDMEAPIDEGTVGRALEDSSPEIRQSAAEMAGDRRLATLVPTLIRMLEDASGDVRETAAEALTEMRTEASHRALRMALTHRDARVRRIAVEYLGDDDK